MFKIQILGYEITISKVNELQKKASAAKSNTALKKIENALISMNKNEVKYSEYALQKKSGVSINTIKKYRSEIEKIRKTI
jgi:ribonucleotide reductase beta subunit family protein with ferritin-like domain